MNSTSDTVNETTSEPRKISAWFVSEYITAASMIKVISLVLLCYFIYTKSTSSHQEDSDSLNYLESPEIDDIYFLDFRVLSDNLRPKEKYRIAKVVDITGDIVTLLYGNLFYLRQNSLKDSIHYGQLRFKGYFESRRYDLTGAQLKSMYESSAIYMIKRPDNNMLYGNYINEPKLESRSRLYIPGKRENIEGLSFLKATYLENNFQQAFDRFKRSSQLGFAQGKVNLGQMYLNGQYVDKDLSQAMYWFKQAALQSNEAGVLKYVIVCRQMSFCQEADFYQTLMAAGVNIKVSAVDLKLIVS